MSKPSTWHSLVGIGFAVAGVSKLLAVRPQTELFESWGWPKENMQVIGAAELLGAGLLLAPATQKLGALLLTATSGCVLQHEIQHGDDELITPRTAMLLAATTGFLGSRRKRDVKQVVEAGVHKGADAVDTAATRVKREGPSVAARLGDQAKSAAGSVASKAADTATDAAAALAQRTASLAADGAKAAGSAVASGAGKLASHAGRAASKQACKLGRKAARKAGKASGVAADYARQGAERASIRARELARAKGWA